MYKIKFNAVNQTQN